MSLESALSSLLTVTAITNIVGVNLAVCQLPQGCGYPALVYEPESGVPVHPIHASDGLQLVVSRVKLTALGRDVQTVIDLHAAVRTAIEFQSGIFSGLRIQSIVRDLIGPWEKDDAAKVFGRFVDYAVIFYDA